MRRQNIPKYLVGIDEVGRGPIAGPVAVGALIFLNINAKKFFNGVKESKQLSEVEREEWFRKILKAKKLGIIDFSVSFQSEKIIDKHGLTYAINKCIETSLNKLYILPEHALILLDGGLKAPKEFINQRTIIRGDAKEKVIALASICAKVLRDRKMKVLAKKYMNYGFEVHKGYGTSRHYRAIQKYGICIIHRLSFLQNFLQKTHI